MGIDIYAKWKKMTKAEEKAQYTGFSVEHGHVGYLREAYHGEPYATRYFLKEAFETGKAKIPAKVLKERLPETIKLAIQRAKEVYQEDIDEKHPAVKSFKDFVKLCAKKEKETGEPCEIIASY